MGGESRGKRAVSPLWVFEELFGDLFCCYLGPGYVIIKSMGGVAKMLFVCLASISGVNRFLEWIAIVLCVGTLHRIQIITCT